MAASMQKLSHKKYRALLKKEKRKQKRQEAAKLRQELEEQQPNETLPGILKRREEEEERRELELQKLEECERAKRHIAWLQREKVAQILFERKKEQEREWKKQQEEAERKIEEELERQKNMEEEFLSSNNNKKTKKNKLLEDALHVLSDGDDQDHDNTDRPTHNPEAPKHLNRKQEECMFYLKTGACRFGQWCSRHHAYPIISRTLLIRNMFSCYAMEQSYRDEYDADIALEFDETETQDAFVDFYDDVLEEFRKAGKVIQFKVCKNWEAHLRGNVYVEFDTEAGCSNAFTMFNARFYAGKQLSCEYSPVTNWKAAICGLFFRKRCPKGKNCNFLHVFRNPGNEFAEADRGPGMMTSQRDGWASHRSHIGTPGESERSHRDHGRWYHRNESREHRRRRSRSRSRDRHMRSRERRRSREKHHRSRSRDRSKSRERTDRSRSRERYRSRIRERESRSKSRERKDRSKSRERYRSRIRERASRSTSRERYRSKSRERYRSKSRERYRSRSKERQRKRKDRSRERESNRRDTKSISSSRSQSRERSRSKSIDGERNILGEHHSRSKSKEREDIQKDHLSNSPEEDNKNSSINCGRESVRRSRSGSKEIVHSKRSYSSDRERSDKDCTSRSRSSSFERDSDIETSNSLKKKHKKYEESIGRSKDIPNYDSQYQQKGIPRESEDSQITCQREQNVLVDGIKQMLENKYLKKHKKSKHKKHKKDRKKDKILEEKIDNTSSDGEMNCENDKEVVKSNNAL